MTFVVVTPTNPILTALGDTVRLTATARDAGNNPISGLTFMWASSDTTRVKVAANGLVTAMGNGATTVTVTTAGVSGSTMVTVSQTTAAVAVTPDTPTLTALGDTVHLTATARDAGSNPISGLTFTWASSDTTRVKISPTGLVTAVANGTATVTAATAGVAGGTVVTVSQSAAAVVVTPSTPTLTAFGDALPLTATARDARGSAISGATFAWASSDTTRVKVAASGLVTAVGNGTATVTATAASVSGSTSVTVSQVTAAVVVTPANPTILALGATLQLTATARDARASEVSGVTFTWSGGSSGVATVSTTGLVTAVANGSATVTATIAGGLTGGTTVTVMQLVLGPAARLSAGASHTCGLAADGTSYCWGWNPNGQLGDGTTTTRTSPVAVVGGLTVQALSTGDGHTCGLTTDGAPYCWGWNYYSQLGDGTTTDRSSPVAVVGGLTFVALAAGYEHTCALTVFGAAYCWGWNPHSELGDGTTTTRSSPVAVTGGLTFQALSVGGFHTCGLTSAGAAYCWGSNGAGQLGDGTTTDRTSPVAVAGGLIFQALTAGEWHTCGLTTAGVAYCWGYNQFGQLGDGTTSQRTSPVTVVRGLTFQTLSAAFQHTCGLTTAGAAYCWGANDSGQLGTTTAIGRCPLSGDPFETHFDPCTPTPVAVTGGLTFQALSAGWDHTCGLTTSGAAYCWGLNGVGELGDGTRTNRTSPVAVVGGLVFGVPAFTPSPAAARPPRAFPIVSPRLMDELEVHRAHVH